MVSALRPGMVVSLDFSPKTSGYIGKVIKTRFINKKNKYERLVQVQFHKSVLVRRNGTFRLSSHPHPDGPPTLYVSDQLTKCPKIRDPDVYKVELPSVADDTYKSGYQITNKDKLETYETIFKHLEACSSALLMESELLKFTEYLKTKYPQAIVEIPNPRSKSFPKTKISKDPGVCLYPCTIQDFLKDHYDGEQYSLVWQDLCKTIKNENASILPLIIKKQAVAPGGLLAITCSVRGYRLAETQHIIRTTLPPNFVLVDEHSYRPSMYFCLYRRLAA